MGEVYRARDTRLSREVAIKVLPAELASDAPRLKRFEKEARAASGLNHPNIVTVYDVGSENGVSYIAMEKVEGETLRKMLVAGALPVKKLLRVATQIAEGLAKAHEAGIVHRDLKPENVMVTKDGLVKILDFGLAKLTRVESGEGESHLPTMTGTSAGMVVGTAGYMSPEQASGEPVDFQSDQFSFGSILYEMATGKRAFQRASAPQTLTAIIQEEPESVGALNPKVPVPLRWVIERCLAKTPRDRYASTEDLARDLATVRDRLSEATSAAALPAASPAPGRRRSWLLAALAVAAILAAEGAGILYLRNRDYFWRNPLAGARFTRLTDWEGSELAPAISADAKFVGFISDRDDRLDVWVGQVGQGEYSNVTKGAIAEFSPHIGIVRPLAFSGDGTQVSITSGTARPIVWLVPTMGGAPRPFLAGVGEAVWSPSGNQVLYHSSDAGDPTFVADRRGGDPRRIFVSEPGIHNHFPTWSPDGRLVYFVKGIPFKDMDVWRAPSAGGVPERVTRHHFGVAYPTLLDERTLIFIGAREDSGLGLYAMDLDRRIEHLISSGLEEYRSVAASADGRRLVATVANPAHGLWTVPISDRIVEDSGMSRFHLPSVQATAPRFGPDYLLHLSSRGGADGLWKLKDGAEIELWNGHDGAVVAAPAVSPDGAQIAFVARVDGRAYLYTMASDGTGARRFDSPPDVRDAPSWSPDGKWIAVVAGDEKASFLFKVPADGGPAVRLVEGINSDPVWSPDGRLILYSMARGGALLHLRAVTPDGGPFPLPEISTLLAGNRYRFLPDGKSFVIAQGGDQTSQNFWLLDLATGRSRQLTNLRPGFETKSFDVSPDGKTILFDRYRENADVVLIDLPPR